MLRQQPLNCSTPPSTRFTKEAAAIRAKRGPAAESKQVTSQTRQRQYMETGTGFKDQPEIKVLTIPLR